jgi:hypothetical protein
MRLREHNPGDYGPSESWTCADHGRPVKLMISSVVYSPGCEECTRAAFAEALERALKENGKTG